MGTSDGGGSRGGNVRDSVAINIFSSEHDGLGILVFVRSLIKDDSMTE